MKPQKTMQQWRESNLPLGQFLEVGDRVDDALQEHFIATVPPIQGGGYVQLGEAYSMNDYDYTYLTLYGDLFLGDINHVRNFPVAAHNCLKIAERVNKSLDALIFQTTFAKTTPESAEVGDFSETGVVHENEMFTSFQELLERVQDKGFFYPSSSPGWQDCEHLSVSSESQTTCYLSGEETTLSLHPKNARSLRYLKKALSACDIQ